ELSIQSLLGIVRDAAELGVKDWLISGGGEPFVRAGIVEVMKEIKKSDMYGDIITNGTLLTEEIIKDLVEANWDRIRFSIDGSNASTHNYLRGKKGAFSKTTNNIKLFEEYKNKMKKEKPSLEFSTVLTNKNYTEIIDIIKLASTV
ncbi:unnamed protein product, partial [marine sediment metagenome]